MSNYSLLRKLHCITFKFCNARFIVCLYKIGLQSLQIQKYGTLHIQKTFPEGHLPYANEMPRKSILCYCPE